MNQPVGFEGFLKPISVKWSFGKLVGKIAAGIAKLAAGVVKLAVGIAKSIAAGFKFVSLFLPKSVAGFTPLAAFVFIVLFIFVLFILFKELFIFLFSKRGKVRKEKEPEKLTNQEDSPTEKYLEPIKTQVEQLKKMDSSELLKQVQSLAEDFISRKVKELEEKKGEVKDKGNKNNNGQGGK